MADAPRLTISGEDGTTSSPARGAEMRNFLQARLQKNRAPPLVHSWDFWHDRQDRSTAHVGNPSIKSPDSAQQGNYEDRLVCLAEVNDVRNFWTVFNNFDINTLPLRDSVHLFHKGIKPVWEDPRNEKGGSWTFRVPKSQAPEFWKEICMLAIGEQLQQAVETDRTTFRDDICGISLGVRFNSMLVQVWNRDGEHADGIQRILSAIQSSLPAELGLRDGSYYYKRHNEHAGFSAAPAKSVETRADRASQVSSTAMAATATPGSLPKMEARSSSSEVDAPGVTRSSPPPVLSAGGEPVTRASKNADPVEDMRDTLKEMTEAMDTVGKQNGK